MNLDIPPRAPKDGGEHAADFRHSGSQAIPVRFQIEIVGCGQPIARTDMPGRIADVCKVALLAFQVVCIERLRQWGNRPQALPSRVEI